MFGSGSGYILFSLARILVGVALLVLAMSWRRQRGKQLMVAFVALSFVASPLLNLCFALSVNLRNYNQSYWQIYSIAQNALSFVGWILLVVYLIVRRSGDATVQASQFVKPDLPLAAPTSFTKRELAETVRRREWALLIDLAPGLIAVLIFSAGVNLSQSGLPAIIKDTFFLVSAGCFFMSAAYLLVKDVRNGRSFGKHFTRCRVVDHATGGPVAIEMLILRNLIFLVPLAALVELVVASCRADRRRIGDLAAGTTVVPDALTQTELDDLAAVEAVKKHPLDD